jgi:hypothetical protein
MLNRSFDREGLLHRIAHELTHEFQDENNITIKDPEKRKEYEVNYNKITRSAMEQNGYLQIFAYLNYFFTKSELSANLSGLYTELKHGNVTKGNYEEVYTQTTFYKALSGAINKFKYLQTLSNAEWESMKLLGKNQGFFKTKTLNTNNTDVFKTVWVNFIQRAIDYIDVVSNKAIYKAIKDNEILIS